MGQLWRSLLLVRFGQRRSQSRISFKINSRLSYLLVIAGDFESISGKSELLVGKSESPFGKSESFIPEKVNHPAYIQLSTLSF